MKYRTLFPIARRLPFKKPPDRNWPLPQYVPHTSGSHGSIVHQTYRDSELEVAWGRSFMAITILNWIHMVNKCYNMACSVMRAAGIYQPIPNNTKGYNSLRADPWEYPGSEYFRFSQSEACVLRMCNPAPFRTSGVLFFYIQRRKISWSTLGEFATAECTTNLMYSCHTQVCRR